MARGYIDLEGSNLQTLSCCVRNIRAEPGTGRCEAREGKERGLFRVPHPFQEHRRRRAPPLRRTGGCLEEHSRWWLGNIQPKPSAAAEDIVTIKLTINTIFPLKSFGETLESSISSNLDSTNLFPQASLMMWTSSSCPSTST